MNRTQSFLVLLLGLVLGAACTSATAANLQQVVTLDPGWNAIFIELEPAERDIETVFAGLPVASVWRWRPGAGGAQFVADPAEDLENIDGWFAWFPEPRPEAFLSNLFRIDGATAYLVKLEGSSSRQLTIRGTPRFRAPAWEPNAFTLTGLPVAAANAPTFAEFFSASSAHQGQPVYELGSNGRWQLVASPSARAIRAGRAYWIYTRGNSNYQGRLHVVLEQGDALEYSAALTEMRLVLRNYSGVPGSFQIERIGRGGMPMSFRNEDPETGEVGWPTLQQQLVVEAPAGEDVFLSLAVLRRDFSAERMDESFAITDEHGQRVLLYAGGNTIQPLAASASAAKAGGVPVSYAGLWVGEISVDAISQAQLGGIRPLLGAGDPVGHPGDRVQRLDGHPEKRVRDALTGNLDLNAVTARHLLHAIAADIRVGCAVAVIEREGRRRGGDRHRLLRDAQHARPRRGRRSSGLRPASLLRLADRPRWTPLATALDTTRYREPP